MATAKARFQVTAGPLAHSIVKNELIQRARDASLEIGIEEKNTCEESRMSVTVSGDSQKVVDYSLGIQIWLRLFF